MKKIIFLLFLFFAITSFAQINNVKPEKEIKNFKLKATDNKKYSLDNIKAAKGFIIVFNCNKCPMAKLYSQRLNQLSDKFKTKNVYLMAINSMDTLAYKEENFALMQKRAKTEKFNFPYLQDKSQKIAKQFGATHTPQAYVIWKNIFGRWIVKYEGAIDDRALLASSVTNKYLETAVDELLANKIVTNPFIKSSGCRIYYRGEIAVMD